MVTPPGSPSSDHKTTRHPNHHPDGSRTGHSDSNGSSSSSSPTTPAVFLSDVPLELQVRTLSYLRAKDLSAVHQVNRYFWRHQQLRHAIVVYCADQVYPQKWTSGFELQPISKPPPVAPKQQMRATPDPGTKKCHGKNRSSSIGSTKDVTGHVEQNTLVTPRRGTKDRSVSCGSLQESTPPKSTVCAEETSSSAAPPILYTFEHLRNMELLVVARVLNSPEPTTGFVVSKSWCKTALVWLEGQQERIREHEGDTDGGPPESSKKKKKKVKKAKKERRKGNPSASGATPPPANINSDITCEHDQLQHYTSNRSARARRRLLDKQAWKILKALYPESTPLPTIVGECLQCHAEACQAAKLQSDAVDAAKQKRKQPLENANVRRFYTRTRGVPEHCLRKGKGQGVFSDKTTEVGSGPNEYEGSDNMDTKMPAQSLFVASDDDSFVLSRFNKHCPLVDGTYYVLPRSWCHGWRRFIKTGEGGTSGRTYLAPDAACLLCDAHRMALLPPHLEAFLYGESSHLLEASKSGQEANGQSLSHSSNVASLPLGQNPTEESVQAMRSLGLTEGEISQQLSAMRSIELERQRLQRQAVSHTEEGASRNELLDRENHSVVEILSRDEFLALEACWPGTTVFALRFTVQTIGSQRRAAGTHTGDKLVCCGVNVCTPVCRSCDTSGRQCSVSIKNRARGWVKKNADKLRAPASLEY